MFNSFDIFGPIPNRFDDLSPNSTLLEELPYFSSYYHLPSPFIYNEIDNFGEFLGHHELAIIQQGGNLEDNNSLVIGDSHIHGATSNRDSSKGSDDTINRIVLEDGDNNNITRLGVSHGSRRRKPYKTDRHSKISTAHGLRDRRMRLSLEVARPFFNLQDMLGYDKASETIEWLLIRSKSAIEEQVQSKNGSSSSRLTNSTASSMSDYQVESIVIEGRNSKGGKSKGKTGSTYVAKNMNTPKGKRIATTKESRREARVRARKRTLERSMQSNPLTTFHNQQNGEISQSVLGLQCNTTTWETLP